jgi:hypothetical protein
MTVGRPNQTHGPNRMNRPGKSALLLVGIANPVADRLGGRLKLSGEIVGVAVGMDQIDYLTAEFR